MRTTWNRRVFVLLMLLLACRTGEGRDDIANVAELVAEEELRIGSVDDPDVGFSRIGGVAVDADGLVYVLESEDRQIRVYDERGRLVRTIGREGAGPGEFASPTLIGFQHDTLAVGDPNLGRITLFTRTGEVLETLRMPPIWLQPMPGVMAMAEPVRFRRDGFLTNVTRFMAPADPPRDSVAIPQLLLDRTGQITDTLRYERLGLVYPRTRVGDANVRIPTGPADSPLYVDGQEDTYVIARPVAAEGNQAVFSVTRLTQAGDTVYDEEITYQPLPLPVGVVDSMVARAVRPHLRNQEADSGVLAAAVRDALSLPPYQPPVTQARLGADEVLWLRLHDDGTDRHRWVLIAPDGRLEGAVSLPRAMTIHWTSGERFWAVVHDEFDVPWLLRYRLRRTQS